MVVLVFALGDFWVGWTCTDDANIAMYSGLLSTYATIEISETRTLTAVKVKWGDARVALLTIYMSPFFFRWLLLGLDWILFNTMHKIIIVENFLFIVLSL